MPFYPKDRPVPRALKDQRVHLRPLRTSDVELDYAAVMESAEFLRRWGGGTWPEPDFDLAGNLADLLRHEREHDERQAFTFTVMNPEQTECLGCVYLEPMAWWVSGDNQHDGQLEAVVPDNGTMVRFWIRTSRLADRLDAHLFDVLQSWLQEAWTFPTVYFLTNEHAERQHELFRAAGLQRAFSVQMAQRQGRFHAYLQSQYRDETEGAALGETEGADDDR